MAETQELKPCPFCGGPAMTTIPYNEPEFSCGGALRHDCPGVLVHALRSLWNRRATPSIEGEGPVAPAVALDKATAYLMALDIVHRWDAIEIGANRAAFEPLIKEITDALITVATPAVTSAREKARNAVIDAARHWVDMDGTVESENSERTLYAAVAALDAPDRKQSGRDGG